MNKNIIGVLAVYKRNIKILTRQRQLILAPFLLPIILMLLTSIIFGSGGDQWPVALIDEQNSTNSSALIFNLKSSKSEISPYFDIVESNLKKAEDKVKNGKLHMLIRIPENFDFSSQVHIETYNVNTDMMKNVRFRVENAINEYLGKGNNFEISYTLIKDKPEDIYRSAFVGGSAFLLALFFTTIILSANLFAFDYENRTKKEILLSPLNPIIFGLGIIITAIFVSIIVTIPVLLLSSVYFNLLIIWKNLLIVYIFMLPILFICGVLGLYLGKILKNYRVIQPLIIVLSMATFFGAGGFSSVNSLPFSAKVFAFLWPFSRIFEWFNPVLHNFKSYLSLSQILQVLIIGILGFCFLLFMFRKKSSYEVTGGM